MKPDSCVDTELEWAEVAPGQIVVATPDRTWIHQLVPSGQLDPFSLPMVAPAGSLATTRRLLEGAISAAGAAAAAKARQSASDPLPRPALTRARWALRLAGYYCTTHATPRLMAIAAERFAAAGRTELAAWARDKVREETGHDILALRDLRAMGYQAERVAAALEPATARALVDYFEASVEGTTDPIGCVGYAFALERLALERGQRDVDAVAAMMPPGVDATRCLRVHSAAGSDAAHVEGTIALVAGLGPDERIAVARACYQTTEIYCTPPATGFIDEEALVRTLSTLGHPPAQTP